MAPRIKNISPDEFKRLFQAPEIQQPGFSVSDAINLQNALEARRKNDLSEQEKIAKIERAIAEEEARAKDVETLALQRGTDAEREAHEVARENIDPTQAGAEEGPFSADDQAAIDQAKASAQAETRLDPLGTIQRQAAEKESKLEFERKERLEKEKQKGRLTLEKLKQQDKALGKKAKLSGLQQSNIVKNKGFAALVDTIKDLESKIPDDLMDRAGSKLQAIFKGNLPKSFGTADQVVFQDLRESVAVAVYKFISGDVGNIAATESARALKLIPDVLDSTDVRKRKIKLLEQAVTNANSALQALANDPNTANLTADQLEDRQKAIADAAIIQAAGGEATPADTGAAGDLTEEELIELEQLRKELQ